MRHFLTLTASALLFTACDGANNANYNANANNADLRNVNVSRPETSPQMPPASIAPGNSAMANNSAVQRSAPPENMTNEKVRPGMEQEKRLPPGANNAPELKGTPNKKP
jgi:hypothetical protein